MFYFKYSFLGLIPHFRPQSCFLGLIPHFRPSSSFSVGASIDKRARLLQSLVFLIKTDSKRVNVR